MKKPKREKTWKPFSVMPYLLCLCVWRMVSGLSSLHAERRLQKTKRRLREVERLVARGLQKKERVWKIKRASTSNSSDVLERWITDREIVSAGIAKEEDVTVYDWIAGIVRHFADHGIEVLLSAGSLLGARRHMGFIPWGDKDVDFMVLSTNATLIEHILDRHVKNENVWWGIQRDGEGECDDNVTNNYGFGYGIHAKDGNSTSNMYIDLWLYGPHKTREAVTTCLGLRGCCVRWWRKHIGGDPRKGHFLPEPWPFRTADLRPPSRVPFGPYLFPAPREPEAVLTTVYTQEWRTMCGGWQRGDRPCRDLHPRHPFVFEAGEDAVMVRQGNGTLLALEGKDFLLSGV